MFGDLCPCDSGRPYAACCQPLHRGARPAKTPVELMRSRYTAYAVGDLDYVYRTWHPRTRPDDLSDPGLTWTGLTIDDHAEDWVEFTARYQGPRHHGVLHERSRFAQRAGRWLYLDGEVSDA